MVDENTPTNGAGPADGNGPSHDTGGNGGASEPDARGQASFEQALRDIGGAGRESLGAAVDSGRALRGLLLADLALARSALGHALAWMGVAVAFGVAACLLAMAAVTALLQSLGLSWLAAMTVTALACAVVTALGGWMALRYLRHTGLDATRRQLRRLGLGDIDDDEDDNKRGDSGPGNDGEPRP